jgi:hypothetical protein
VARIEPTLNTPASLAFAEATTDTPAGKEAIRGPRRTSRALAIASLAALFALTALFRFLALSNGFTNDHFIHLANAQQVLLGDWPTRDFLDYGMPLMYFTSGAAQYLFDHTLFGEAVVVAVAFALAAVLTAQAVRELTGSWVLGLAMAALEVAIVPRAYGYPKILTYAIGFFLIQRYVSRPTTGRLLAIAAAVVVAFLFRHDHGAYLGVGGALAALLVPPGPAGVALRARRALTFGAVVAALTAPYVAFVQVHGGVWRYLRAGLEFGEREFRRAPYRWPTVSGEEPLHAILFYEYWALPLAAGLLLVALRRRVDIGVLTARVVPLMAVAALLNGALARPPFSSRLPDAVVPAVMLAGWLIACAWHARRTAVGRPVAIALLTAFAASIVIPARAVERLEDAGLLQHPSAWSSVVEEAERRLLHPYRLIPSATVSTLVPFYEYLNRCTTTEHRLLIVGLITEVSYFAQRGFAGGQVALVSGYFEGEAYQRAVVATLQTQSVPFVVIPGRAYTNSLEGSFPIVAAYVRPRYRPLAAFGDVETTGVQVFIDSSLPATQPDDLTGWPCLTAP